MLSGKQRWISLLPSGNNSLSTSLGNTAMLFYCPPQGAVVLLKEHPLYETAVIMQCQHLRTSKKYSRQVSEDVLPWGCALIYSPCISVIEKEFEFVLSNLILFSLMGLVFPLYIMGLILLSLLEVKLTLPHDWFHLCILPQRDGTLISLTMPPCREASLPEAHITMKCSK